MNENLKGLLRIVALLLYNLKNNSRRKTRIFKKNLENKNSICILNWTFGFFVYNNMRMFLNTCVLVLLYNGNAENY